MPTINIQLFEGRTVEQKRELAKAITEATCKTLKCDPGAVDIIHARHQKRKLGHSRKTVVRLIHYRQTMKGLPAITNGNPASRIPFCGHPGGKRRSLYRHTTQHDRNRFIHQGQTVFPNL